MFKFVPKNRYLVHTNCVFVLGGTNDHIELIEQLKNLAYHVVLVDYFKEPPAAAWAHQHEMVSTRDLQAIETIIKEYQPVHIFSACVDSSLCTLAECQAKFGFHTLFSSTQYDIISNKHRMKAWMHTHRFPTGQFQLINNKTRLVDIPFNLPVVVKPTMGNSSKGVSLINNEDDWQHALNLVDHHAPELPILVEEFIDGTELSVDLAFLDGQAHIIMISEIIKKTVFSSTITKNIYSSETEARWENDILALANSLGDKLKLNNSLMLLQCIVNTSGISIVEFSLRIGGGSKHQLIKQVKNINMITIYIHMMLKEYNSIRSLIYPIVNRFNFAAIEYIYPESIGYLTSFNIQENNANSNIFIYKKPGDLLSSTENSSNRIAGIFVWGNEVNEINQQTNDIKQTIRIGISPNKTLFK